MRSPLKPLTIPVLIAALTSPVATQSASTPSPAQDTSWVAESNRRAQVLLDVIARFGPEGAGRFGLEGLDEQITVITEDAQQRARQEIEAVFNSTNVEGWGLYAEWMMLPHMPPDGQLVSLQFRLMRAARAFLDPELHLGKITPDEARRVLREDVVLSDAMTAQEVERYMFRSPGQATSYFYGYTHMRSLRADVERAQGKAFNARGFHDFVLSQGLLPPKLLRDAVMQHFVKRSK